MEILKNKDEWILMNGISMQKYDKKISTEFTPEMQDNLYFIEDQSWWFQYRSQYILKIMESLKLESSTIYDIGGGNGYTSMQLQNSGQKVCLIEPSLQACVNAKKRGIDQIINGSISEETILDCSLENVILLDVLEHIEKDKEFLCLLNKKMKVGGNLIITVPAFQNLWSSEDENAGHYRRYKKIQIMDIAKKADFQVSYCSYFFSFLYLPVLLGRVFTEKIGLLKKVSERSNNEKQKVWKKQFIVNNYVISSVLSLLEKMELKKLLSYKKMPFGSSVVIIAKKL